MEETPAKKQRKEDPSANVQIKEEPASNTLRMEDTAANKQIKEEPASNAQRMEGTISREQRTENTVAKKVVVLQRGSAALMEMMRQNHSDVVIEVDGECYHANWHYLESRSKYFAANRRLLEASATDSTNKTIKVFPPVPALFKDALLFIYTQELNNANSTQNFVGNLNNAKYLEMETFSRALEDLYLKMHQEIIRSPDFNWKNISIKDFGRLLRGVLVTGRFAHIVAWARGLPDDLALEVRTSLSPWLRPFTFGQSLSGQPLSGLTLQNVETWEAEDPETAGKVLTYKNTLEAVKQSIFFQVRFCLTCATPFYLPQKCRCTKSKQPEVYVKLPPCLQ